MKICLLMGVLTETGMQNDCIKTFCSKMLAVCYRYSKSREEAEEYTARGIYEGV